MQGISVYSRPGRPTFYVAYDCPLRAKRINESSGIRLDDPRGKLAAYAYAREKSHSGVSHGQHRDESTWGNWVDSWLRMRFAHQQKTLTSYLGAWKFLEIFLREHHVPTPRALTYQHAVKFVLWREQLKKRSGKFASRNTALHNVKVLSRIMREAVRRGYAPGNPCFRMSEDVPATKPKEKPPYSNEQVALVRAELDRREGLGRPSDWMRIAFEIALHQGCRISATQIPFERINFDALGGVGTIQFHEKGDQVFTVPIHPELRPLLLALRAEGRRQTCVLPRFASRNFGRVMRALKLPQTMHSARVTVISRLAQQGVSEQHAMAYVHHANWSVHKIYQRMAAADVTGCHAALSFSRGSAAPQSSGAIPATPRPWPGSTCAPKRSALPAAEQRAAG